MHAVQQRAKISFHGFTVPFRVFFLNLCNDTNTNLPRAVLHLFDTKAGLGERWFKFSVELGAGGKGVLLLCRFLAPQERLLGKQEFSLF